MPEAARPAVYRALTMKRGLLLGGAILVLWLAAGTRFYRLDFQSFWNDEGNSARLSERSLDLIIEGTASDIHPPLYYLLLRGWREPLGASEFSLRALSAFAGVMVVAATIALGRFIGGRLPSVPLAAGILATINPALVYYGQEARMYTLMALWAVLSTLMLFRLLPRLGRQGWRRLAPAAVAYIAFVVAGLYTHYFFPAVLLAQNLWVGLWWLRWEPARRRLLRRWFVVMVVALIAYLPWLPIFWRQTGGRAASYAVVPFLADATRWLGTGETGEPSAAFWVWVGYGLLLLLGLVAWWRRRPPAAVSRALNLYLLMLLVPVLFMVAAGTTQPAFFKFMLVTAPFLALLGAYGVAQTGYSETATATRRALLALGIAGLALIGWSSADSLRNMYFDPAFARDDYRAIAARIARADHANAAVILNAPNQWEVFTYYYTGGAPVYPLPRGRPTAEGIDDRLSAIAGERDRLYALFWGETQQDPDGIVETWLDSHAFKAAEEWVGDVRFVVYAVPPDPATVKETAVDVDFGERIRLSGYTVRPRELEPGDIIQTTLFWEALAPLTARYKVFLHLLDAQGNIVSQRDDEPGGGTLPTTDWEPGSDVVDNHGVFVPETTPPGSYTLRLGLYDAADPTARLQLPDGSDSLSLGVITVR